MKDDYFLRLGFFVASPPFFIATNVGVRKRFLP